MSTITPYYKTAAKLQRIDISFEEYQNHYIEEGWFSRKAQAIPCFFITLVTKTIYHLAMAIIFGIPKFFNRDSNRFQAEICNITRDVEEAFGCIVVIFNDQRGSYYFDRSQFFKEKYITWAMQNEPFDTPPPLSDPEIAPPPSDYSIIDQVKKFNDPSTMPEELRKAYEQHLLEQSRWLEGLLQNQKFQSLRRYYQSLLHQLLLVLQKLALNLLFLFLRVFAVKTESN